MATDREVFLETTAHRRPERVLYYASFTPDIRRRVIDHIGTDDIGGHYGFMQFKGVNPRWPADHKPIDYSRYWEGVDLPEGATINGLGVASAPGSLYHFRRLISPLRNATTLKEIEDYPIDEFSGMLTDHMAADATAAHAAGKIAHTGIGDMYEAAWQVRGYEEFLMDMIARPAWAECLLEKFFQKNLAHAKAAAAAGTDLLACGDDVANQNAMMFAPPMWRKMIHSRWAQVWRAAKEIHPGIRIRYHSDGNVMAVVGELVDAGLDILNPVQPECLDTDEIHRRFGDRLSFDGCMGTQSTMPLGTPEDVRARVKEVIDKYGQSGGVILAPTHTLEPEVPIANIDAFVEACQEYGHS